MSSWGKPHRMKNENDEDECNDKDVEEDREEDENHGEDENHQNKDIGAPATVSWSIQSWTSCMGSTLRGTGSQAYSDNRRQEYDWEYDIPMFLHITRHVLLCSNSISLTPRLSRCCFLQVMVLLVLGCKEWTDTVKAAVKVNRVLGLAKCGSENWRSLAQWQSQWKLHYIVLHITCIAPICAGTPQYGIRILWLQMHWTCG